MWYSMWAILSTPPHLLPTIRTIPLPFRLFLNPDTTPMEPFIWTLIVVTRYHVSITDTMTNAILPIITLPFIIGVLHLHILVILISSHAIVFSGHGSGSAGLLVATAPSRRGFLVGGGSELIDTLVGRRGTRWFAFVGGAGGTRRGPAGGGVEAFGCTGAKG